MNMYFKEKKSVCTALFLLTLSVLLILTLFSNHTYTEDHRIFIQNGAGENVNDNEPETTVAKPGEDTRKLLSEAIDYITRFGADLFTYKFDLLAKSVVEQRPFQLHVSKTHKPDSRLAPALYVFGDSLSDSGNNNFLQTSVKVNFAPYGIDFPSGPTGRFTNGKTFVDFIAELLGLPFAPPYMGLSANDKSNISTGVNYASGSAGILKESGTAIGENLSFEKQIQYFERTVSNDLPKIFKASSQLLNYLSKSIFVVSIGNNDYINNYLQPSNYQSSHIYTPLQFATLLVDKLKIGLKKLYSLGARKFLVFNIGRIGCIPHIGNSVHLYSKAATPCVDDVNSLVVLFNSRLYYMMKELEHTLAGSTFVYGDSSNATQDSSKSGKLLQTPCCNVDGSGMCIPYEMPCENRKVHIFWDAIHPTEAVYDRLATDCFSGSVMCVPINVQQLANKL